jgi:hypothetical protein
MHSATSLTGMMSFQRVGTEDDGDVFVGERQNTSEKIARATTSRGRKMRKADSASLTAIPRSDLFSDRRAPAS